LDRNHRVDRRIFLLGDKSAGEILASVVPCELRLALIFSIIFRIGEFVPKKYE
jgi:hypothetical protein